MLKPPVGSSSRRLLMDVEKCNCLFWRWSLSSIRDRCCTARKESLSGRVLAHAANDASSNILSNELKVDLYHTTLWSSIARPEYKESFVVNRLDDQSLKRSHQLQVCHYHLHQCPNIYLAKSNVGTTDDVSFGLKYACAALTMQASCRSTLRAPLGGRSGVHSLLHIYSSCLTG
jgi:hypothetical protein